MERTNETDKLDLSPHACIVAHGTLTKAERETIEAIKIKYNYRGDLYSVLIYLPSWANSHRDIQRQKGRPKTIKKLFEKTAKALATAQKYLSYFSSEMRTNMIDTRKKINHYEAFSSIEKHLPFLIQKCEIEASRTPPDKGGQISGSIPKDLIWLLLQHYEYNTMLEATCGWHEESDCHIGEFYNFLIEIEPIIKKLGIKIGKDRSIGQYARELLTSRREKRNEITAYVIIIMLLPDFFALHYPNTATWLRCSLEKLYLLKSPQFNLYKPTETEPQQ